MKLVKSLTSSFLFLLLLALATPAYSEWPGTVVKVTDGDTLAIKDEMGKNHRVRLWGIDAPELEQTGGAEAARHLCLMALPGMQVRVHVIARDRYGRQLALVSRQGRQGDWFTLNGNMVLMGHAWRYGAKDRWKIIEQQARDKQRGLWWHDDNPAKPWLWRNLWK